MNLNLCQPQDSNSITFTLNNRGNYLALCIGWYIYNGVKHEFKSDIIGYDESFTVTVPAGTLEITALGCYTFDGLITSYCPIFFYQPTTNKCVRLTGNPLIATCTEIPCNSFTGSGCSCTPNCNMTPNLCNCINSGFNSLATSYC